MSDEIVKKFLIDFVFDNISSGSFEETVELNTARVTHQFSFATGIAWNSKRFEYQKLFLLLPNWINLIHPIHRTFLCERAIEKSQKLPANFDELAIERYLSKVIAVKPNRKSKVINENKQFKFNQNIEIHSHTKKSEVKDTLIVDEIEKYYLDRIQLSERGWTKTLIERFLPNPDRWATVNHWRNYTGKATYFIERVVAAEQLNEFKKVFEASIVRRGLTKNDLRSIKRKRSKLNTLYRSWVKTLSPEDIQHMLLVDSMAEEFESARAQGYRTPHK